MKNGFLLTSKLFISALLGSLSIIVSLRLFQIFVRNFSMRTFCLVEESLHLYWLLLYSASLDFANPKTSFGDVSFLSNNENRSLIMVFILSALVTYLFYLFPQDSSIWIVSIQMTSSFKVLLIGILYLVVSILYLY